MCLSSIPLKRISSPADFLAHPLVELERAPELTQPFDPNRRYTTPLPSNFVHEPIIPDPRDVRDQIREEFSKDESIEAALEVIGETGTKIIRSDKATLTVIAEN